MQELDRTVELRKTDLEAARQVVLTDEGKKAMDAIRSQVSEMEQEEQGSAARANASRPPAPIASPSITGVLAALLALVMFVGFIYLLRQNFLTRAKAAAVVHEQREWFRTTLASIGDAVIATNTEGRITFLNPVAQQLTGWNEGEACGLPLEDVFKIVNEQTHQTVENPATKALREGTIVGLANHTLLINKQGGESPIDDSASPIRNDEGEIAGVVLVFRDVAIRRQAEKALHERSEQLAEADRMKNEFLAMLAHELRNPLAPIQNALQLIRVQGFDKRRKCSRVVGDHGTASRITGAAGRRLVGRQPHYARQDWHSEAAGRCECDRVSRGGKQPTAYRCPPPEIGSVAPLSSRCVSTPT